MPTRLLRKVVRGLAQRAGLAPTAPPASGREEGQGWYDRLYAMQPEYQKSYEQSLYYFLWSVIVDRVRRAGIKRILEIGCGPGQLAAYLLDQGVEAYTGLDFSPTAIEMAKRRATKGEFLVGDARDPEIHHRIDHDLVICTEVLEHIDADLVVVSNFLPGKRCFCSVPNFPYPSHVRHFTSLDAVRERYGPFFESLDIAVFNSPNDPADQFYLMDGVRPARVVTTG